MLAATLPFISVVAAFGIAPDTVTEKVELTRKGYLQVDRLLPAFFGPQHRTTRYT